MNKKDRINELINSLINLTKQRNIEWYPVIEYLERNMNEKLRHYIIENNEYYDINFPTKKYVQEYASYCTLIDSGIVYIFTYYDKNKNDSYYVLAIQNIKTSNIIDINVSSTYQDEIRTLLFYIKDQTDNIDSFVDSIIKKGNP